MTIKKLYASGLVLIIILLLTGFYLQYFQGMMPCPLCTLQRFCFGILGILFLVGIFLRKRCSFQITNFLLLATSLAGVFLAGRQTWLQHFPPADNTECGVSLKYMLQVLPLRDVMDKVFAGGAECTQRGSDFLFLNMAEWSLIAFCGFTFLSIYLLIKNKATG